MHGCITTTVAPRRRGFLSEEDEDASPYRRRVHDLLHDILVLSMLFPDLCTPATSPRTLRSGRVQRRSVPAASSLSEVLFLSDDEVMKK